MFEGRSLIHYFEFQHLLRETGKMSITEFNAMLPWTFDVEFALMKRDQEERKNKPSMTHAGQGV